MFSRLSLVSLAKAALFKNQPIYVQFYVTPRCNLACEQCNIIYANSDMKECSLDQVEKIAENLAKLKVAIVLLTGGEPFTRKDLPQIIQAFESRGIHVRMQTNGLASEEQIVAAIEAGGHDISISLDTLHSQLQDKINGAVSGSWQKAIQAIAAFTQHLPKENSFASLGCVMQPQNLNDIEGVIKFGTAISWFTSLVPIHVTPLTLPRGFQTFDSSLAFSAKHYSQVESLLIRVHDMQKEGYLLYDSKQYLEDIVRFVRNEPTTWRTHNKGRCDSPGLYFVILPNGEFAPCCDFRMRQRVNVYDDNFVKQFSTQDFKQLVNEITGECSGCMYGSFPEMTIAMRFLRAKIQRVGNFFASPVKKTKWPLSIEQLLDIASRIYNDNK